VSRPVAVVTGAGRGIGLAIAREVATDADLAICARTQRELDAAARELSARTRVCAVRADVASAADVQELFTRCRRELGPVRWLVNNAGALEVAALADLRESEFDRVIATNLKGPYLCMQAALPDLAVGGGRVVNIGSVSGTLGTPRLSAYNASKWGLNGLTKSWAEELRDRGVLVAAVLPGSVDTDMLRHSGFSPDMQPEDVARVVRFLLRDAPFAMTGALVDVFG